MIDRPIPGSRNITAGPPTASIQLPLAGPDPASPDEFWTRQPRIEAAGTRLFDGISIEKTLRADGTPEPGSGQRTLRVPATKTEAGVNQTGYFEKGIQDASWTFHPFAFPDNTPPGNPIGGPATTPNPVAPAAYGGTGLQLRVVLDDFILQSSPARLRIDSGGGALQMKLHFYDGMRQVITTPGQSGIKIVDQTRTGPFKGRELDGQERVMYGTVEVSDALIREMEANPLGETSRMLWTFLWSSAGSSCPSGFDSDLALCCPKCEQGHKGVGLVCGTTCPANFVDTGLHCLKPAPSGRGVGFFLWDKKKSEQRHG